MDRNTADSLSPSGSLGPLLPAEAPAEAAKKPVLLIVHQETSDPGRIGQMLTALGHPLDIRRPCLGHELPENLDGHAGTVIFGGPMSANDDHIDFIRKELDFIPRAVESGKPYLGICLGAQLLARAGGARVAPHKDGWHEIGYFPMRARKAGRHLFPERMHVYQWHGEGFDLPKGGLGLASTKWFENQAFRFGPNAIGVQFHPDVTGAMMQRWMWRAAHRLVLPGAQSREEQRRLHGRHDPVLAQWTSDFLPRWLRVDL